MHPAHVARYTVLAALGLAAIVAATIVDAALGAVVVIMAAGIALLVAPLVFIHFDEHEERLRPGGPGAHG